MSAETNQWNDAVQAERQHQRDKGYDADHDAKHGVDHLLMWAQDYARRGEPVKSAALIESAREVNLPLILGLKALISELDRARMEGTIFTYGRVKSRILTLLHDGEVPADAQ